MKTMHKKMALVVGLGAGAFALTTATGAQAADIQFAGTHVATNRASFGNSLFGATYGWTGSQQLSSRNATSAGSSRVAGVQNFFDSTANVFGVSVHPLTVGVQTLVDGTTNDGGLWNITAGSSSGATVLGTAIYISGASTCTPAANHVTFCTAFSQSLTRTLFSASATFTIGVIPVTVSASVIGNLHTSQSSRADASKFIGLSDSINESQTDTMSAGAYVQANLTASAGIPGASAGVTTSFKLIDITVSPTSTQRAAVYGGGYTGTWGNSLPITLSSMSGSVGVTATLLFSHYNSTLFSWTGSTVTGTIVDDTANFNNTSLPLPAL